MVQKTFWKKAWWVSRNEFQSEKHTSDLIQGDHYKNCCVKDPHQSSDLGNWAARHQQCAPQGSLEQLPLVSGMLECDIACPPERTLTLTMLLKSQKQLKVAGRHLHFFISVFRIVRASRTQLQRDLRVQFWLSNLCSNQQGWEAKGLELICWCIASTHHFPGSAQEHSHVSYLILTNLPVLGNIL